MGIKNVFSKIFRKKSECCCMTNCKICQVCGVVVISVIVSVLVSNIVSASKVKSVINKDPKFIIEALQNMEKQERQKSQEQASKNAPEVEKKILSESKSIIGNKNASKSIVVFFDYNCGHCKREATDLKKLIDSNNVKVVLVDLPILSEQSYIAAQVGVYVALNNNNKLASFYELLNKKNADKNGIKEVLKSIGLPENYVEKAQKDQSVVKIIQQNYEYAKQVGLQGTPALIVNGKFIGGAVSADDLRHMLG